MNLWDLSFKERVELVASKWIENLRSGKFQQGYGFLCRDNKYCCLGVLCETVLEFQPDFLEVKEEQHLDETFKFYEGERAVTPYNVCRLLGIGAEGEFKYRNNRETRLTFVNDDQKKSFEKIAKIIETNKDRIFNKKYALIKPG